jgi:O-antigen ligase
MKSLGLLRVVNKNNSRNLTLFIIGLFTVIYLSITISLNKWIYLGFLTLPLFIYLTIEKPFIFPFGAYAFLLPFDSILSVTGNVRGDTLTKLVGILAILILLMKGFFEKKFLPLSRLSIPWILFLFYCLASTFWAIEPAYVLDRFSTIIGFLLFYLIFSLYKIKENEFNTCQWLIILGGFLAAIFAIYFNNSYEHTQRITVSYGSRATDPNQFAFTLLLPVSVCLEQIINQRKRHIKIMLGIIICVIIFSIIQTGSRGGFLGVFVITMMYLISIRRSLMPWLIIFVTGILIISVAQESFISRWTTAIESGGAGRVDIWKIGIASLKDYWVFGAGLSNFPIVFNEYGLFTPFTTYLGAGSHNIFLKIMVELGIVGFLLFVWAIVNNYKTIRTDTSNNHQVMLKAAFWGMLISSFFLDTLFTKSFWLLWMLILMQKNYLENKNTIFNKFLDSKI